MIDITKGYSINNWQRPVNTGVKTQVQESTTPKKSVLKNLIFPSVGLIIGAAVMGRVTYTKCDKNIKLKYAGFTKEKIKEFLKLPEAKPYVKKIEYEKMYYEENKNNPRYQELIKGRKHYNLISYFKELKILLAKQTEKLKKQKPDLEDESTFNRIKINFLNIGALFDKIKIEFWNKYNTEVEKSINSIVKNSFIGGFVGAIIGTGANFLGSNKSENK